MRIVIIILLLWGAATSLHNTYVSIDFLENQDYIAQELCENLDKPELNCEGRCFLKKRMNSLLAEMKAETSNRALPEEISFMFYFYQEIEQTIIPLNTEGMDIACCIVPNIQKGIERLQTPPPRIV